MSANNRCPHCHRSFTRRDNMLRHINEKRCKSMVSDEKILAIEKQLAELKKQTDELTEQKTREINQLKESTTKEINELKKANKPINQVLQVICVSNNDNYLDMLIEKMGNFTDAIEYIKDCALSDVTGDCKLIEKVYMDNISKCSLADQLNMCYVDRNRTKIAYYNDKREKVTESKLVMGKKLANNLQNSYLKSINYLINRGLENHDLSCKVLDDFDLLTWNTHIYNLSDSCFQKKIINQLNIPDIN